MKNTLFALCVLTLVAATTAKADDLECRITDADTDADLDNAGVNPRCPDSATPWACYCKYEETCEGDGHTEVFHRKDFLGCGSLSDCSFSSPYGQECESYED